MAQYNKIVVTCNNLPKFKEIIKKGSVKNLKINLQHNSVIIKTYKKQPEKDIQKLSIENPELIFIAKFSYAAENHSTIHTVEYQKGESKVLGLKACYRILDNWDYRPFIGDSYDNLSCKAIELFRRIDVTREHEDGKKYIDFERGILLSLEDENYQIQFSKDLTDINIKCFKKEKHFTITYEPIEHDFPF